MKFIIYSLATLFTLAFIYFLVLSLFSRNAPQLGLLNGQLQPCPTTPNCVCSEYTGNAYIEPIGYSDNVESAWKNIKMIVVEQGGEIIHEENNYLRARFVSRIMRFVDDLELRNDTSHKFIQVRSSSRVGHSDMGVNKKRVESIRKSFDNFITQ